MPYKEKTLEALSKKAGAIGSKKALLGFDGFVDKIVLPVRQRHGTGDQFEPIDNIPEFAKRIESAAGTGTNIEIFTKEERPGGNGPNMAAGLLKAGMNVHYVGALGNPIRPVFKDFAKKTEAISIGEPGETQAIEFNDGKIMLNNSASLDSITYENMLGIAGEGEFLDYFSRADLIGLMNWTMVSDMTSILDKIINITLPAVGPREGRAFFFDLSDPAKRSEGDLRVGLETIKRFQYHGDVILSLNINESVQVAKALGLSAGVSDDPKALELLAVDIRQSMEIGNVVIHGIKHAVSAGRQDTFNVKVFHIEKPKISTGGGDYFNAGFAVGHVLELPGEACLTLGNAFAGYYISHGLGPSLNEVNSFISGWK